MRLLARLSLSLAILSAAFTAAFVGMAQTQTNQEITTSVSSARERGGVVSGRVLNERGEPVVKEPISLMKTDERGGASSIDHRSSTCKRPMIGARIDSTVCRPAGTTYCRGFSILARERSLG